MRKTRLLWKIYPAQVLVVLVLLLGVFIYARHAMHEFHYDQVLRELRAEAIPVADRLQALDEKDLIWETVDPICKRLGREMNARVTVVLASGGVIGESDKDPGDMENHANRPEIQTAFQGEVGHSRRYSDTLRQYMLYVGSPVRKDGRVIAVVRTAASLAAVEDSLRDVYSRLTLAALILLAAAAIANLLVARRITKPIEAFQAGAERFARGELSKPLSVPDSEEMAGLAETMNRMATELDDRIRTVTRQRNQQEAVFSSLTEGVMAIDDDKHILSINPRAAELLGLDREAAVGRSMAEVIRVPALIELAARVLREKTGVVEGDVYLRAHGEQVAQVHGTGLQDAEGRHMGAVLVLNDVTRVRRLEEMRKDFVANVSHELKTPVTSIKGFVETLLDGAAKEPERLQQFLGIIARQTDRIHAIINDLLTLSKLENDVQTNQVILEQGPLKGVLADAIEICSGRARQKNITIDAAGDGDVRARINAPLLEQALINLIDNAIKYSAPGTRVRVETGEKGGNVFIRISDQGCGIERKHHQRIFERFYRVDTGRSRELGGTGLGLAIVRHIALAHRGTVELESTPGEGSIFSMVLPSSPR